MSIEAPLSPVDTFVARVGLPRTVRTKHFLDAISDEESLWRPKPDIPPVAWHVAHLATTEALTVLAMSGNQWDIIPAFWQDRYVMGAELPNDGNTLLPLSEVMPITEDLYEKSGPT